MKTLYDKVSLILATYAHAHAAIRRQFNYQAVIETRNRKLQKLIRYALRNIKYYRELFATAAIDPEQIRTAEDLRLVPVLTKEQIRERFWDFLPSDLPQCRIRRTSGSTGAPLCVLSDRSSRMFNSAAVIRYRNALGVGFIAKPILTPLKTPDQLCTRKYHWTFLQGIHKTYYINPYLDSKRHVEHTAKLLRRLKNPALIGITPAIRTLAHKIHDRIFPAFRPCAVLTTGEYLDPKVRSLLESVFETKVTDIYACTEAGDIAWQCHLARQYHINAENCIVEILKNDIPVPNGHPGEVVITNLNRYAMPIIRYKTGDIATLTNQSCPCGCRLPTIEKIVGRTGRDIILPNEKIVPWQQLKGLMNDPRIRQFQLIQDHKARLTIKYVPERNTDTQAIKSLLLRRFEDLLGNKMPIEIRQVTQIAPAPGGKTMLVVSNYKPAK